MREAERSAIVPAHNSGRDYRLIGRDGQLAVEKGLAGADWYRSPIPRKRLKELRVAAKSFPMPSMM